VRNIVRHELNVRKHATVELKYSRVLIEDRSYFGKGPFFDVGFVRYPIKQKRKLSEL
jgi:hypothetical protein